MSRREFEEQEEVKKERKLRKVDVKKVKRVMTIVLFIAMLGLSFIVADRLTYIILNTSVEMLSRIINVILVAVIVGIYFKK